MATLDSLERLNDLNNRGRALMKLFWAKDGGGEER